uniref:Uncharacterized protein n=1 Tax=Acrobeloides nanus TaxID=290746 RepID=A0A914C4R1_9BILA
MPNDVEKLINEDIEKTLIRNLRSIGFVLDDDENENTEENEHLVDDTDSNVKFFNDDPKKKDDLWSDCSIVAMITFCIIVFVLFFCWLLYLIGRNASA